VAGRRYTGHRRSAGGDGREAKKKPWVTIGGGGGRGIERDGKAAAGEGN